MYVQYVQDTYAIRPLVTVALCWHQRHVVTTLTNNPEAEAAKTRYTWHSSPPFLGKSPHSSVRSAVAGICASNDDDAMQAPHFSIVFALLLSTSAASAVPYHYCTQHCVAILFK